MAGRGRSRSARVGTARRDRHGRGDRSPLSGPRLPLLQSRIGFFDQAVAETAQYLRELWPDELKGVRFEIADVPSGTSGTLSRHLHAETDERVPRYRVFPRERRIVLYRIPIQRMTRLHRRDELHRRMAIEGFVFRAVADLLGRDPWDLAPERYRHY